MFSAPIMESTTLCYPSTTSFLHHSLTHLWSCPTILSAHLVLSLPPQPISSLSSSSTTIISHRNFGLLFHPQVPRSRPPCMASLILNPLPISMWAFLGLTISILTQTVSFTIGFLAFTNEFIWSYFILLRLGFCENGIGDRMPRISWNGWVRARWGCHTGWAVFLLLLSPCHCRWGVSMGILPKTDLILFLYSLRFSTSIQISLWKNI